MYIENDERRQFKDLKKRTNRVHEKQFFYDSVGQNFYIFLGLLFSQTFRIKFISL